MAFMISVVHNFVNNDCTTPKKQKLRNEINWNEIKWIFNSQKKPITATEKNSCENMKWKMIWKKIIIIQQSSPFLIPQKNWIIMKKKWIVIQFGLKYLKRTSLCTWKVHIPFLSTTLQNTAQSRAKKCLFCIQNKKSCQTIIGQMILKKQKHFGFPPISILTYPFSLQRRCAHFCLIFFIQISVKIDILLTFVSKLPIS